MSSNKIKIIFFLLVLIFFGSGFYFITQSSNLNSKLEDSNNLVTQTKLDLKQAKEKRASAETAMPKAIKNANKAAKITISDANVIAQYKQAFLKNDNTKMSKLNIKYKASLKRMNETFLSIDNTWSLSTAQKITYSIRTVNDVSSIKIIFNVFGQNGDLYKTISVSYLPKTNAYYNPTEYITDAYRATLVD